jgi:hypothetical protein
MDFSTLSALVEEARTSTEEVAGASFRLRRPSVDGWIAWSEACRKDGQVDAQLLSQQYLPDCVVGWNGVTLRHFGADSDSPVDHSLQAVRLLLADNKAIETHLTRRLVHRVNEAIASLGADAKNSSRVSAPS